MTEKHYATCRTPGCENCDIPIEVPEWALVLCGGGCNNFIQQEDPTHPDFPHEEPEETLEDMIRRILQEELSKVNTDSDTIE